MVYSVLLAYVSGHLDEAFNHGYKENFGEQSCLGWGRAGEYMLLELSHFTNAQQYLYLQKLVSL